MSLKNSTVRTDPLPLVLEEDSLARNIPDNVPYPTMKHIFGEGSKTPLEMTHAEYVIEILPKSGIYKQSTKMTFKNFNMKRLEGELIFPLPEKATICGYALDVNGAMIDAVVVEQQKAKQVFEQEVRQGKSVSVVEKVIGNNFKTKVYPIEAQSSRTVQVHHFCELKAGKSDLSINIPLEVKKHKNLESLTIQCTVMDAKQIPMVSMDGVGLKDKFQEKDVIFECMLTLDDLKDASILDFSVVEEETSFCSVENNKEQEAVYFNISELIEPEIVEKSAFNNAKVALFWDSSLSRDYRSTKTEFTLLEKLFQQGTFKVDIYRFSYDYELIGSHDSFENVINCLKSIKYDGATNLNNVRKVLDTNQYDFALLFSDGMDNLADPREGSFKLKKKTPIYSLTDSISANHQYLESISQTTGGQYFSMNQNSDLDKITSLLGRPPFGFISYEFDPESISDMTPSSATQISQGNTFSCSGILLKDKAELTICFGTGKDIKITKKVIIDKSKATNSNILGTLWASRMISELSVFADANSEQILSLGKKFSLVSPMTSFIFLSDVEQYIKHKITPPKTLPLVLAEYQQNLKSMEEATRAKVYLVSCWWAAWKKWYDTDYYKEFIKSYTDSLNTSLYNLKQTQDKLKNAELEESTIDQKHKDELETFKSKIAEEKMKLQQYLETLEKDVQDRIEIAQKDEKFIQESSLALEEEKKKLVKLQSWVDDGKEVAVDSPSEDKMENLPSLKPPPVPKGGNSQDGPPEPPMWNSPPGPPGAPGLYSGHNDYCAPPPPSGGFLNSINSNISPQAPQRSMSRETESRGRVNSVAPPQVEPSPMQPSENTGSIKLAPWSPDLPYLNELKQKKTVELYDAYFGVRPAYSKSPAFYLDVADYFYRQGLHKESLRILTNTLELELESAQLIRVVAYKLEELGALELAEQMFRRVLKMHPHEPQSLRDLALVLGKSKKYKESIQLLWKVVTGKWDERFSEIEITALVEMNRMIVYNNGRDIPSEVAEEFIYPTVLDLRIIMAWDTDRTDIDLHTHEPNGDHVYFGAKNSRFGGLNSRDFTRGYGPETYQLKNAAPGKYTIKAKYYASHQDSLTGGTTILLSLYTHYGDPQREKCQQITIRLNSNKEIFTVGEITINNEKVQEEIKLINEKVEQANKQERIFAEMWDSLNMELYSKKMKQAAAIRLLDAQKHEVNVEHEKKAFELNKKANEAEKVAQKARAKFEKDQRIFQYEYFEKKDPPKEEIKSKEPVDSPTDEIKDIEKTKEDKEENSKEQKPKKGGFFSRLFSSGTNKDDTDIKF